jgi:O-acetyl-ADP-ribose deacetylase (regulator of RNase III)
MIHYVKGDATEPIGEGHKLIVHICNDIGAWGAGFTAALDVKWSQVGFRYKSWCANLDGYSPPMNLGDVQFVSVDKRMDIANMIAQNGLRSKYNPTPIDYDALKECLKRVCDYYSLRFTWLPTIHMPRIGTGLAGGKWELIEPIIQEELADFDVYVYDLV